MGQRHQYIVIYPEKNLNKDNPNNLPERAEVIHHQWLYGRTAILSLQRVLKLAKNSFEEGQTDYLFGRSDRGYTSGDGTHAIAAAMSCDPDEGYFHRVSIWEAADWNGMKKDRYYGGPSSCDPKNLDPDMFDNNDGITVIRFRSGEKLPGVAFITPNHIEGSHWDIDKGRGPFSAAEYLQFYYSVEEQMKWPPELKRAIGDSLSFISENSRLMGLKELQSLLPKFELEKCGAMA